VYKFFFKRLLDFSLSITLLICIFPFFFLLIIILTLIYKGTPFFVQKRPGKNEKIFSIIKLKTMNDKKGVDGALLPDVQRLTPVGKFIRKTSLDEIPQLVNVLKGDMSFIGPRPLLIKYLPFYSDSETLRHSIRPGITGLAQVSGRNLLGWNERLAKDIEYVHNVSLKQDVQIVFKTIKNVISSKDIVIDPRSLLKDLDDERRN